MNAEIGQFLEYIESDTVSEMMQWILLLNGVLSLLISIFEQQLRRRLYAKKSAMSCSKTGLWEE